MGWFLVELKSPQDRLFNKERFSSKANEGLNQLASYLSYANEKQGFLRDALEIPEFRTPKGILVIGRGNETEQNENSRELKAFWNDNLKNIEIISYDKILHTSFSRIQHQ